VGNAISGMGSSYDATFAVAYAIAATRDAPIEGATLAAGLRRLSGGTPTEVRGTKILAALQELAAGREIAAIGTLGALAWDDSGAISAGAIEIWCVGVAAGKPAYQSSGLTFDIATQRSAGTYVPCSTAR
jgi:hypothetical protein